MQPNEADKKENRIIIPMSHNLLVSIDDYRFSNRCESRAEAVRILIEKGLAAEPKPAEQKALA